MKVLGGLDMECMSATHFPRSFFSRFLVVALVEKEDTWLLPFVTYLHLPPPPFLCTVPPDRTMVSPATQGALSPKDYPPPPPRTVQGGG